MKKKKKAWAAHALPALGLSGPSADFVRTCCSFACGGQHLLLTVVWLVCRKPGEIDSPHTFPATQQGYPCTHPDQATSPTPRIEPPTS